jgi:hypothetical protein
MSLQIVEKESVNRDMNPIGHLLLTEGALETDHPHPVEAVTATDSIGAMKSISPTECLPHRLRLVLLPASTVRGQLQMSEYILHLLTDRRAPSALNTQANEAYHLMIALTEHPPPQQPIHRVRYPPYHHYTPPLSLPAPLCGYGLLCSATFVVGWFSPCAYPLSDNALGE